MCKIKSDFRSLIRQKAKNKSKNKDFENNKRDLGKESHVNAFFFRWREKLIQVIDNCVVNFFSFNYKFNMLFINSFFIK